MGPKKKAAYNDFYFFMQNQKKVLRNEGRVWNTMDELVQICSPRWKQLPETDRARYKEMAKNWKEQERHNLANKFDHSGRSLLDIEQERIAKEQIRTDMLKKIEDMVDHNFEMGTLLSQKFYFVHFNTLCQIQDGNFVPCEMGVSEFSLMGGITKLMHAFILPRNDLLGYSYAIQKNADLTHKITMDIDPIRKKAASSYSWILKQLKSLLSAGGSGNDLPPIFTLEPDADKVNNILDQLFVWGEERWRDQLKVYHLEELYFRLADQLPRQARFGACGPTLAREQLQHDAFLYPKGNACLFHEEVDRPLQCSMYVVRKWGYTISEHCYQYFDVQRIPGRHVPLDVAVTPHAEPKKPLAILMDTEAWRLDAPDAGGDQRTPFGAPRTKAAPAGYSVPLPTNAALQMTTGRSDMFSDLMERSKQSEFEYQASSAERSPRASSSSWRGWGASEPERSPPQVPDRDDSSAFPSLGVSQGLGRGQPRSQASDVPTVAKGVWGMSLK